MLVPARRSAGTPVATGPALPAPAIQLSGQNHALARLLSGAGNRDGIDRDATPPSAATDGPLRANEITRAWAFYRQRADRFSAEIVSRLQERLDVTPDGEISEELIQRVAGFQKSECDGRPPLAVDGMAGPSTLILLFPDSAGNLSQLRTGLFFAATSAGDVIEHWDSFESSHARANAMIELVNRRLKEAGVPPVGNTAEFTTTVGVAGEFDLAGWYIQVAEQSFADDLDADDRGNAATLIYHEARHAEQAWLQVRALLTTAPSGPSNDDRVAPIAEAVGVPERIVEKAVRAGPLADPVTALIGTEWQLTSDYSARREATAQRFLQALNRHHELQARDAGEGALNRARDDLDRAADEYYSSHPIEFDAERVDNLIDWALQANVADRLW